MRRPESSVSRQSRKDPSWVTYVEARRLRRRPGGCGERCFRGSDGPAFRRGKPPPDDPAAGAGAFGARKNLTAFVNRSLKNLNTDAIDLLQLHCPPTEVYYRPEVFEILDDLVEQGKLRHYGASVEKVEEALKAIEFPNVQSVQIIFNIVRQRPADLFFAEAQKRKVGILARVPLASGLLSGRMSPASRFPKDDHRNFNRHGEAFDRGETFSGVDFETGLKAVEQLKKLVPSGASLAQFALRWILEHPAVSCAIPGARRPTQVTENIAASELPPLAEAAFKRVRRIYNDRIKPMVHQQW